MNLCTDGHEEICFEGRKCPACEIAEDKNREIETLNEEIASLKSEIEELKGKTE